MTTQYVKLDPGEAQPGDEILQAGEWVAIDRAAYLRDTMKVTFPGGGTKTGPVHHFTVRRAVEVADEPEMPLCTDAPRNTCDHGYLATQRCRDCDGQQAAVDAYRSSVVEWTVPTCYHPRSCLTCQRKGAACGRHTCCRPKAEPCVDFINRTGPFA